MRHINTQMHTRMHINKHTHTYTHTHTHTHTHTQVMRYDLVSIQQAVTTASKAFDCRDTEENSLLQMYLLEFCYCRFYFDEKFT